MAPRKKKNTKSKIELKTAQTLVSVLVLAVLTTIILIVPSAQENISKLLGITQSARVPQINLESNASIHFIDVGQADAVLLEESGEFALIDAGLPENDRELVEYLKQAGVTHLRYMVMTHPHADHYGGMQTVLEQIPTDLVLLPDFSKAEYPTTSAFENLLQYMLEENIQAETAYQNANYALGQGNILVVHDGVVNAKDYNLISLGLLFESNGLRYLSTGDGEKANEALMLQSGLDISANVFKAGHHGSSTSNTASFLERVQPEIVVISCALGNSYGHPHRGPLTTFTKVGSEVLRTDYDGSILIKPDGNGGLLYKTSNSEEDAA